jgi:thiamine monophosphate synthase
MFIIKNNYYFYIDNCDSINLDLIRIKKKITIIYRNNSHAEDTKRISNLRKACNQKKYKFYVANNIELVKKCKADGLYLSSYNKEFYHKKNLNLIGSAHNHKEIYEKQKQGCHTIILSRIFKTNYQNKKSFLGTTKFNLITQKYNHNIVPLGGINNSNLLMLNIVASNGFALLSEIKKKPVISNRLF